MTTVVFYKGVMVADSLETQCTVEGKTINELIPGDMKFRLVTKIERITVDSKAHLIGLSGDVPTIVAFIKAYKNSDLSSFKPKAAFRAMDWDQEKLVVWHTHESMRVINVLLNALPWVKLPEWKMRLKKRKYNYNKNEEVAYVIGSGSDFCHAAYHNLKFQFQMVGEKMEDHLKPLEVAKYLVKIASFCDSYTNNKVCWSVPDGDNFTPVSPQNASLSKG